MTNSPSNHRGSIQISGDTVIFERVEIKDPVIAAEFRSALENEIDLVEYAFSLLDIGARTAALRTNSAGAEKIEASLKSAKEGINETARSLEETIKKQVKDLAAEDGQLLKGIEGLIERYQEEVEELANGEDSELRKVMLKMLRDAKDEISKDVKGTVQSQEAKLSQLLDPQNPQSPLRGLATKVEEVAKSLAEMRGEEVTNVLLGEVIDASPKGGNKYEDIVVEALQVIASNAGDDCVATGSEIGKNRRKSGDAVVDLKVGSKVYARMVVEAKNSALNQNRWIEELKKSKAARGATGFIGLCKYVEDMPTKGRMWIIDSQSIVLAYNPDVDDEQMLKLIYHLVRMNTLNGAGSLEGIDIAEVNALLEAAVKSLDQFDELSKQVTQMENAAKKVRTFADEIRDSVSSKIMQVQRTIRIELQPAALESASIDDVELEAPKELEE